MHPNLKDAGKVFVVSVNDAFVMKAWGETLDPSGTIGVRYHLQVRTEKYSYIDTNLMVQIRFLADQTGEFTKALDLDFDATKIFGNFRSKRYALVVEDGKVKYVTFHGIASQLIDVAPC